MTGKASARDDATLSKGAREVTVIILSRDAMFELLHDEFVGLVAFRVAALALERESIMVLAL